MKSMKKHKGSDNMVGILLFIALLVAYFITEVHPLMLIGAGILALLDIALIIIGHSGGDKE